MTKYNVDIIGQIQYISIHIYFTVYYYKISTIYRNNPCENYQIQRKLFSISSIKYLREISINYDAITDFSIKNLEDFQNKR